MGKSTNNVQLRNATLVQFRLSTYAYIESNPSIAPLSRCALGSL